MKRFSVVAWISALLLSTPVFSGELAESIFLAPEFPAREAGKDALASFDKTINKIRVRIFPHLENRPPQGQDRRIDQVTLKTSGECHVFEAWQNPPEKGELLLYSASVIELRSAEFSEPLWIECTEPVRVVREGGKKSFHYSGPIFATVSSTAGGRPIVELVNILSMPDYLNGVVPIEMPSTWHPEALKAQAVAARTYAYYHLALARKNHPKRNWDVDDTVLYQAFTGIEHRKDSTDRAVSETEGQVLLYKDQVPQAFFSADSGGYTADPMFVWGVHAPYCSSKPEIYDEAAIDQKRWGTWKRNTDLGEINRALQRRGFLSSSQVLTALWLYSEDLSASGRVGQLKGRLDSGQVISIPGNTFRFSLGLRSTRFTLALGSGGSGTYLISGRGHGHGVGMSQLGAHTMATSMGYKHAAILKFYYSQVNLCTIDSRNQSAEITVCR